MKRLSPMIMIFFLFILYSPVTVEVFCLHILSDTFVKQSSTFVKQNELKLSSHRRCDSKRYKFLLEKTIETEMSQIIIFFWKIKVFNWSKREFPGKKMLPSGFRANTSVLPRGGSEDLA